MGLRHRLSIILIASGTILLITLPIYFAVFSYPSALDQFGTERDVPYSESESKSTGIKVALALLGQQMNGANLTQLRKTLAPFAHVQGTEENAMVNYLRALGRFADNMDQIENTLTDANASLASGNYRQASQDLTRLQQLRDETRPLLKSLYALWTQVESQNRIHDVNQIEKIRELDASFQEYALQISNLAGRLKGAQGFVATTLTLNASKRAVYVNQSLIVEARLVDQNNTALPGRNVTLSWGYDQTLRGLTDPSGRFAADVTFPIGFPSGHAKIRASYRPEENDTNKYLASSAEVDVTVEYEPSRLVIAVTPNPAKAFNIVHVTGTLSTVEGEPLSSRLVHISVGTTGIGVATTDLSGRFDLPFVLKKEIYNGTTKCLRSAYCLQVIANYTALGEPFAESNATVPFFIEVVESEILVNVNRNWVFSGTNLFLNGTVAYDNGTFVDAGNVTVYLDGKTFFNSTVGPGGSFGTPVSLPFLSNFGPHSIAIEYSSPLPWVQSSRTVVYVEVYNTAALIAVVSLASVTTVFAMRMRKSKARQRPVPAQPVVLKAVPADEFTPERLRNRVEAETTLGTQIRAAYRLAQELINSKLGQPFSDSETHWEYFERITKSSPGIKAPLKQLTELYELNEYSPHGVEKSAGKEATRALLALRSEIETVN